VRTVISNASPLITLAKADLLELLPEQFSDVMVPQAVVDEILQGPDDDPMRRVVNKLPWLKHISLEPALTPLGYWQLGRGESEVIEYARRTSGTLALLDDKDARGVAMALDIPVMGTLGIVAKSTRKGGGSFDHRVKRLQEAGLYLNESVISAVRKELGETSP
jgi:predicted nucleic acid-binding protein